MRGACCQCAKQQDATCAAKRQSLAAAAGCPGAGRRATTPGQANNALCDWQPRAFNTRREGPLGRKEVRGSVATD